MWVCHEIKAPAFILFRWLDRIYPFLNVLVLLSLFMSTVVTCVLSCISRVQLFATPWTVALQAPPSMGFSRQESCSGLPFPPPGDLPTPGIEPASPTSAVSPALQLDSLSTGPLGKPSNMHGPREYHTNWSTSNRERQITMISYTWNLKYDTKELITKQVLRHRKQSDGYQRGKGREG